VTYIYNPSLTTDDLLKMCWHTQRKNLPVFRRYWFRYWAWWLLLLLLVVY